MGRLLQIWRSWSVRRRVVVAALVTAATVGIGVAGYLVLKRPPDVSNRGVDFAGRDDEHEKKPQTRSRDRTQNWPTYGYDQTRTRYFPSQIVRPPFAPSEWSFQAGKLLEFSPIVVDDVLYFMDIDARFYALDARTGRRLWKNHIGKLNASSPAYRSNRLYAVNLEPGQAVKLRAKDGKVLWRKPLPGRSESSPLVYGEKSVIFGCECGTVFALDIKDGSIDWQVETAGAIKGALALSDGYVYGGNYAGEFFAIDADTGKVRWKVNTIGGSFGRGGGVYSTPAIAYGRVYFGSIDSRIYSLDKDTGQIAWSKSTGAEVYSGPALAHVAGTRPSVYIGSADGNFYALDAETGATRWQQPAGGQVTGAPSVIGNVVYVSVIGDDVGTIGYDVDDGKVVFEHELGEYNPAITDGRRLYLTGYSTLRAFPSDELVRKERRRRRHLRREGLPIPKELERVVDPEDEQAKDKDKRGGKKHQGGKKGDRGDTRKKADGKRKRGGGKGDRDRKRKRRD